MSDTKRVLEALGELDAPQAVQDRNLFTTSTGVVFRVKPVSPLLVRDIGQRLKPPVPPKYRNEDKDTYEENPNDPTYQRELEEYQETVGEATNAVLLTRGTQVEGVPQRVELPEDTTWVEDVQELTGIEVPIKGARRYYCWVKYVAVATIEDFSGLLGAVTRASGVVSEREVSEELANFRGVQEGDTDTGISAQSGDSSGDRSEVSSNGLRA